MMSKKCRTRKFCQNIVEKKHSKFRPCRTPRYLKFQVQASTWRDDLRVYNAHLKRVHIATTYVDDLPPKLKPYFNWIKKAKMREDLIRAESIQRDNIFLVKKIFKINSLGGEVDTVNPLAYFKLSNWAGQVQNMKKIDVENKHVYRLLVESNTHYSRDYFNKEWQYVLTLLRALTRAPLEIFKKTSLDTELAKKPSISGMMEKLAERPKCFLEFKVVDGENLGRITIELYHDHVPVTVQNFIGICCGENNLSYKDCNVHRMVRNEFIETGDVTRGTGTGGFSIYGAQFDEENHMLKHTKAGVLSMVRTNYQKNDSKFLISLKKLDKFDRKHVVFGKVVKGAKVLFEINKYSRYIGKPLRPVIISNCGLL